VNNWHGEQDAIVFYLKTHAPRGYGRFTTPVNTTCLPPSWVGL